MSVLTVRMIWNVATGDVSVKNLSGPINIAEYAGFSARQGILSFLSFLAIVSVSLFVLNLLPIPILDGGQVVYQVAELVKGSPLSERAQARRPAGGHPAAARADEFRVLQRPLAVVQLISASKNKMRLKYAAALSALLAVPAVLAQTASRDRISRSATSGSKASSASAKARSTTTCRSTSATASTQRRVDEALRALYGTGFFRDMEVRRDGGTLVIAVLERPSIESFTITGNKDIKTEDLEKLAAQRRPLARQDLRPVDARRSRRATSPTSTTPAASTR
jgi:hypothetical protein